MLHGRVVGLRTMETDDLGQVKAVNDDPVVRGNVVGWGWPSSLAEMGRWHQGSQGGSTHRWVVVDADDRVLGVTGLWGVDWHDRNAMTALKLGGAIDVRNKGLGTDAIKLVMAFAFYDLGLERLHTSILATNAASLRAYGEKCGWTREGLSRRHVWRHGRFVDVVQLGILREEFDQDPDAAEYRRLVGADS